MNEPLTTSWRCTPLGCEAGGPPQVIQVLPWGRTETERGAFVLDPEGMASILEDFGGRANEMVIDYEHQTLTGGEAPAAGWVERLLDRGRDGLWAEVRWTPRAARYIEAGEYRYLSPVFLKRQSDERVVRLLNAGLTNQPAIDGMVPLANRGVADPGGHGPSAHGINQEEVECMCKELLKLLGLQEDADPEQAVEAARTMAAEAEGLRAWALEVRSALGLPEETAMGEVTGSLLAMKQGHEQAERLSRDVAELTKRLRLGEAEAIVGAAMKQGKVTPAQRDWALGYAGRDPEGFRAFAAKAPVLVHLAGFGPARADGQGGATLDALQAEVNRAMGITAEAFRKFNN